MAERKTAGEKARKRPAKRSARKAGSARRTTPAKKPSSRRWSQRVTEQSAALDLEQGVFKLTDPKKIAASLKRSAERSSRRKAGAYRSALSMLTFYINRAGKGLPRAQRERLEPGQGRIEAGVREGGMTLRLIPLTIVIPAKAGIQYRRGLSVQP